jgi:hypothetical protein
MSNSILTYLLINEFIYKISYVLQRLIDSIPSIGNKIRQIICYGVFSVLLFRGHHILSTQQVPERDSS